MGRLVLSRSVGESILIGEDVEVTFVGLKGSTMRISISAPEHVDIARSELRDDERQAVTKGRQEKG